MHVTHKMATCCYCGSTTTLNLAGRTRHELVCARCGAPLRKLKQIPVGDGHPAPRTAERRPQPKSQSQSQSQQWPSRPKPKKGKRRKGAAVRFIDIAEEIFDIFD